MMKIIRNNLGVRGSFLFATILAILLAASFLLWINYQARARTQSIIADGREVVNELYYFTRHWIMAKDKTDFTSFAKGLFTFGKVTQISIWDAMGRRILEEVKPGSGPPLVVRSRNQAKVLEKLVRTKTTVYIEHGEKHEIWAPIFSAKLPWDEGDIFSAEDAPFEDVEGFVRLVRRAPTVPMKQFMLQNIAIALLSWFVCSATAYFLAWLFVRPVSQITEKMWAYVAGLDFDPPPDDGKDEIGKLAKAFNRITEKARRTEKESRGRLELLTELLENAPDATVFASMNGEILLATDRTAEILGYLTTEELVDRAENLFDHFDRNDREPFQDFLARAMTSPPDRPEPFSMMRSDQSPVRVELTLSFASRRDAEPAYFVVSARPSEEAPSGEPPSHHILRNLDHHMSESLSATLEILASEIITQTTQITLNTPHVRNMWQAFMDLPPVKNIPKETSVAGVPFSEARKSGPELLEQIQDGGLRIGGILKTLLKTVRVADDTQDTVNLNGAVRSAVGIMTALVPQDTKFSVTPDEALPVIRGNRRDFDVMMVHLLKTVCHSLKNPDTTVHVSTFKDRIEHKSVILIFGGKTGISRDDPQSPERPETETVTPENFGDTALGFAIAKKIARRYGGMIRIDSPPDTEINLRIGFPFKKNESAE